MGVMNLLWRYRSFFSLISLVYFFTPQIQAVVCQNLFATKNQSKTIKERVTLRPQKKAALEIYQRYISRKGGGLNDLTPSQRVVLELLPEVEKYLRSHYFQNSPHVVSAVMQSQMKLLFREELKQGQFEFIKENGRPVKIYYWQARTVSENPSLGEISVHREVSESEVKDKAFQSMLQNKAEGIVFSGAHTGIRVPSDLSPLDRARALRGFVRDYLKQSAKAFFPDRILFLRGFVYEQISDLKVILDEYLKWTIENGSWGEYYEVLYRNSLAPMSLAPIKDSHPLATPYLDQVQKEAQKSDVTVSELMALETAQPYRRTHFDLLTPQQKVQAVAEQIYEHHVSERDYRRTDPH